MNKQLKKRLFNYGGYSGKIKYKTIIQFIPKVSMFLSPFITTVIIDKYFPNNNIKMIIILAILYYVFEFLGVLRQVYMNFFSNKYQTLIANELKIDAFKNAIISKCEELDKYDIGSLIEMNTSQADLSSMAYISYFTFIYHRISIIICNIIILMALNYKLAIIVLIIYIVSNIILIPIFKQNEKISYEVQQMNVDFLGKINEFVNSYTTSKTLRIEKKNIDEIDIKIKKLQEKSFLYNKYIYLHSALLGILGFISLIIVVYYSGISIINGLITISLVILFKQYTGDIENRMNEMISWINSMNNSINSFKQISKLLDMKQENDNGNLELKRISNIEFKNVKLSYDNVNTVLEDINFKVNKNITIAIVGKSGAGKTSLVNLIPRFYELTSGNILINGIDYNEYSLSDLRSRIGYVFQDPIIFNMSIYDNLKFGNDDVTNEQIEKVCTEIGLDEKIKSLPNGYNTLIDIYSDLLSYGEKQLLNFSREILRKTDVIILDEVTSNLDLEFEKKVMIANKRVLENKISFVIAHRLNTIKDADLIFYLQDGIIKECGTHKDLVKLKGEYFKLYFNKK